MSDLAFQYMTANQPQGPEAEYEAVLQEAAENLNEIIIAIAGEEAEWQPGPPFVGIDRKKTYQVPGEVLWRLAGVRESANSVLNAVDMQKGG